MMYGQGTTVTALPASGTGAAVAATASGNMDIAMALIVVLALWTIVQAARAGWRLTPKREV